MVNYNKVELAAQAATTNSEMNNYQNVLHFVLGSEDQVKYLNVDAILLQLNGYSNSLLLYVIRAGINAIKAAQTPLDIQWEQAWLNSKSNCQCKCNLTNTNLQEKKMPIQAINARNQFKGKIIEIVTGPVVSEVIVGTPFGTVTSVITTRSINELELRVGSDVVALVKSTEVSLAKL
jgi:molybdopterin-binding protein